ncbi:hypothetical protein LguiA_027191 [Lonicera macranthoides]
MATRIQKCKWCNKLLIVPFQAQTVHCPSCRYVNYITPATTQYNGNVNNGYYQQLIQQSPRPPVQSTLLNNNSYYQHPRSYNNGYYKQEVSPPPLYNDNYYHQVSLQPVYGRKRAVLCGVSYRNTAHSLDGSVDDVESMKRLLIDRMGFPDQSVLVLTEAETHPLQVPTADNIQRAFRWLIQGCQSGDSLVFYYTGHASRVPDDDNDEFDNYDEALCPVDYKTAGKILDDEINATIVRPLPRGAKLHAIIDTCYSGTILDLYFMCRMNSEGKYYWEDHQIPSGGTYKGTNGGIAICISACDDHQHSGNTTAFTGKATGALTHSFIEAVQNEPTLTYGRLLNRMRTTISELQKRLGLHDPAPQVSLFYG